MAQIRSSRWWATLTAVLASALVATLAALVAWDWPGAPAEPLAQSQQPQPSITATAAEPIDHPAPLAALPLTAGALQAVDSEWILFEYDSSAVTAVLAATPSPSVPAAAPTVAPEPDVVGPRYLYLADRTGQLYAAADLGVDTDLRLLAWLPDHRTALVVGPPARDGASPSAADADDTSLAVMPFDLVTGDLGDPFPPPPGRDTRGWTNPRVTVSRAGDGLLVSEGPASARQLVRVALDGSGAAVVIDPVERGAFLEGEEPHTFVSRELDTLETVEVRGGEIVDVTRLTWSIVSYAPPAPAPEPTVAPSASASPSPSPSPSPTPTGDTLARTEHFLPGGETRCTPTRWPAERQLLILCDGAEGTATVYTFAPGTSTYVLGATLRWDGRELLTMSPDGTRVFVGETMYDLFAEPRWSVDLSTTPAPLSVTWAGQYAVLAGDAERPAVPATELVIRERTTGRVVYVVSALPGAVGFGAVLAAPSSP